MQTGEGKTLVATMPAYLNALTGKGVHIVTVNDYLARRDRYWMGPIFEFLGLTVGLIQHASTFEERKIAYRSDICLLYTSFTNQPLFGNDCYFHWKCFNLYEIRLEKKPV